MAPLRKAPRSGPPPPPHRSRGLDEESCLFMSANIFLPTTPRVDPPPGICRVTKSATLKTSSIDITGVANSAICRLKKRIITDHFMSRRARLLCHAATESFPSPTMPSTLLARSAPSSFVPDPPVAGTRFPVQLDKIRARVRMQPMVCSANCVGGWTQGQKSPICLFSRPGHIDVIVTHPMPRNDLKFLCPPRAPWAERAPCGPEWRRSQPRLWR